MTRALIGASLKTYSTIFIRYDGDQTIDELEDNVKSWVSSSSVKELIRNGNIDKLGKGFSGTEWMRNKGLPFREVHSVAVPKIGYFTMLLDKPLNEMKAQQFDDEYRETVRNTKNPKQKTKIKRKESFFKDDGFKPEVILYCRNTNDNKLEWSAMRKGDKDWRHLTSIKDQDKASSSGTTKKKTRRKKQ